MTFKNASLLKIYEFKCDNELLQDSLNKVVMLKYERNMFNDISVLRINDLESFKKIHEWFQLCVDKVFYDLKLPESFKKIIITESWVNKNGKNEYHHKHTHPNSFLSGIFYLTSNSSGKTNFLTENMWYSDEHLFQSNSDESTYDKYNIFSEKPEAGKLLIFPSKLSHNVEPNMSDTRRYSISFNAYPEIHDKQHTTYLNIKVLPYSRNIADIEE
jgi:uncharacterized protein (TIGR02466 family)